MNPTVQDGAVPRGADGRAALLSEQGGATRRAAWRGRQSVQPAGGAEGAAGGNESSVHYVPGHKIMLLKIIFHLKIIFTSCLLPGCPQRHRAGGRHGETEDESRFEEPGNHNNIIILVILINMTTTYQGECSSEHQRTTSSPSTRTLSLLEHHQWRTASSNMLYLIIAFLIFLLK